MMLSYLGSLCASVYMHTQIVSVQLEMSSIRSDTADFLSLGYMVCVVKGHSRIFRHRIGSNSTGSDDPWRIPC